MKKCMECGQFSKNNESIICARCGGRLIEVGDSSDCVCRNCGTKVEQGSAFCKNCGYKLNADNFNEDRSVRYEKRNENGTLIAVVAILLVLFVSVLTLVMFVFLNKTKDVQVESNGQAQTVSSGEETYNTSEEEERRRIEEEAKKREEEERLRLEAEARQKEEEERLRLEAEARQKAEAARRQEDLIEIDNVIDNFLYNYVKALNYGDSSYMLPYTMQGTSSANVFNTQAKFITSGIYVYEEFIDSYPVSELKYEDSDTCVISVREILNVQPKGGDLKHHEQIATYRMKRDYTGEWKVYEFVGSVKPQ